MNEASRRYNFRRVPSWVADCETPIIREVWPHAVEVRRDHVISFRWNRDGIAPEIRDWLMANAGRAWKLTVVDTSRRIDSGRWMLEWAFRVRFKDADTAFAFKMAWG